jgi:two-component system, NarL family, sensor histidine kinase UhpB
MIIKDENKTKAQLIEKIRKLEAENISCRKENEHLKTMFSTGINDENQAAMILHDIIEYNPVAIQIFDKYGITMSVNKAHFNLFKATPPDTFCLFTDPQFAEQGLDKEFQKLKKGETITIDSSTYNLSKFDKSYNDELFYIKSIAFPVLDKDGQAERFVMMQLDITKEKQDEIKMHELNQQLRRTTAHLQHSIEEERLLISQELHDHLGQLLTGIKLDLDAIVMNMADKDEIIKIKKIVVRINQLISSVKNFTATIRPVMLSGQSMKSNIDWYVSEFEKRNNIKVTMDIDYSIELPDQMSLGVFRIIQEALTNVSRHSKAGRVELVIKKIKKSFHMIISDDGIGIRDELMSQKNSFGIIIMNERVESMGGKFSISTANESGTEITINIPLKS